jgi:SurA N-terminal domain
VKAVATLGVVALALLVGCGGGGGEGGKAVAHVRGEAITKKQLDALVDHFRKEAQREGRPFPKEGTAVFEQTRSQLLRQLVYWLELKQGAKRLGVTVTESEIAHRLPPPGSGEEQGPAGGDTYAHDAVEAQLLLEHIYAKVTRGVGGATPAERSARRNRKMSAFLSRLRRETKVRYEPGYAPGP